MKRIPECEAQPTACYTTNVQGSANVARACIAHGVKRCVGISTDKACAAITTYGASKRLMESIFQAAVGTGRTTFTLVRYGNVVASRGSVVPIWRQQAAEGKRLTITDRRCTRFWMSESDAVRVIERAARMPDGTITVPKMGALSLVEMAEIIAPGCQTSEIGLRSCEKVHEDLIHVDESGTDDGLFYYTLTPSATVGGVRYTSDTAPRLSQEAFLAMLAEAEAHE